MRSRLGSNVTLHIFSFEVFGPHPLTDYPADADCRAPLIRLITWESGLSETDRNRA
jgi:hypothetical protein